VPQFRVRFLAPLALLLVAACGGNNTAIGGSGTNASAASTTSTSPPVSNGVLHIVPATWALPSALSREILLTDGHQLVGLGGLNAAKVSTSAVFSIDPTSGTAQPLGNLIPAVHDAAGAFLSGKYFVFAGGTGATPPITNIVQAVSAAGGNAQNVGALPQPRADLGAAVVDNTAYVVAGSQETQNFFPSVLASTDGATWRTAGTIAQPVRYPAVTASNGAVYIIGGVTSTGADTTAVQRYDPKTGTTTVIAQLPAPTSHASAVALGTSIYVLGGFVNNTVSNQVLRVDLGTGAVSQAGMLPAPLSDAAVATIGSSAYLAGGQGPDSAPVTAVYTLTLASS
jgi:serine/threonine-protein kinase PknK